MSTGNASPWATLSLLFASVIGLLQAVVHRMTDLVEQFRWPEDIDSRSHPIARGPLGEIDAAYGRLDTIPDHVGAEALGLHNTDLEERLHIQPRQERLQLRRQEAPEHIPKLEVARQMPLPIPRSPRPLQVPGAERIEPPGWLRAADGGSEVDIAHRPHIPPAVANAQPRFPPIRQRFIPQRRLQFYVVAIGRQPGIYNTWDEAFKQTNKFPGNLHIGCSTYEEAEEFMRRNR